MSTAAVLSAYNPASYDHHAYDNLYELEAAHSKLVEASGYEGIRTVIRDLFMRYGMNDMFAVVLLHRHFSMEFNEKLVEYGLVSSPWPVEADEHGVLGGSILPRSWRVFNGELYPYEFRFVPERDLATTENPIFPTAFVKEFRQVLSELGLDNVLGIQLIDHSRDNSDIELMEVTFGRNSIMTPVVNRRELPKSYVAAWSFVEKADAKKIYGVYTGNSEERVVTRHSVCIGSSKEEGVVTRHSVCIGSSKEEGVVTRHSVCIGSSKEEGVVTRHSVCIGSSKEEGVVT